MERGGGVRGGKAGVGGEAAVVAEKAMTDLSNNMIFWGAVLVAGALWVWFGIGDQSYVTVTMMVLGAAMAISGGFFRGSRRR